MIAPACELQDVIHRRHAGQPWVPQHSRASRRRRWRCHRAAELPRGGTCRVRANPQQAFMVALMHQRLTATKEQRESARESAALANGGARGLSRLPNNMQIAATCERQCARGQQNEDDFHTARASRRTACPTHVLSKSAGGRVPFSTTQKRASRSVRTGAM